MRKLGIIADDLTGADDAGVQFSKHRLRTVVVWDLSFVKRMAAETDVMVINTETRTASREEAYLKVSKATRALVAAGFRLLFKKMDSTLRGNIGAELDAASSASGKLLVLVAPAFPKNRRTTLGGQQLLEGVPLEYSVMAKDSLTPVTQSHITDLIQTQTSRRVGHIPLAVVASGTGRLRSRILAEAQQGNEILVLDAVTNEHLGTIAKTASELDSPALLAGSAGLAEEVPLAFNLVPERKQVLVVAGSMSKVTAKQVSYLAENFGLRPIELDLEALLHDEVSRIGEVNKAIRSVRGELDASSVSLLTFSKLPVETIIQGVSALSDTFPRQVVLKALGSAVAGSMSSRIFGLVLTGGDTAMAVMDAISAEGIRLEDEVESGIALGVVVGGAWHGLRVVTKAGAFGDELSLARAVECLRKR